MVDNRLTAVGSATGEIAPDRAEWTLAVHEVDADAREAFSRCSARLRALAGALEPAEVTIGAVGVTQQYDQHGHRPTGRHQAYGSLAAVAAVDAAGAVAAAGAEHGADRIDGPRFLTPDHEPLLDELAAEAVRAARRRAEKMAEAAGRTLGRALSIRDDRASRENGHAVFAMAASGGVNEPPVAARKVALHVTAEVVFELD
jgi:uncharacterized protein YggE